MTRRFIIRRFRRIDFAAILILIILWAGMTTIVNSSDMQFAFMVSLLITAVFISFTALLIQKKGSVTLFCLIGAIITAPFNNLIAGYHRILVLVVAGIIFEIIFARYRNSSLNHVPFNLVLAAALSNASMPWVMMFLTDYSTEILVPTINFSLSALLIGVIGSLIAHLLWYNIKASRVIIKFEYSV